MTDLAMPEPPFDPDAVQRSLYKQATKLRADVAAILDNGLPAVVEGVRQAFAMVHRVNEMIEMVNAGCPDDLAIIPPIGESRITAVFRREGVTVSLASPTDHSPN